MGLPSQELLLLLLDYDRETGELFWRERTTEFFKNDQQCRAWNGKWAGKEAFTAKNECGYHVGNLLGSVYRAHRVIWKMMTGAEPPQIDHENHNRADNRWHNLRAATRTINQRNMKLCKRNTSGVTGVSWFERDSNWRVRIGDKTLGYFLDKESAAAFRKLADRKYGYHENHGTPFRDVPAEEIN